MLVDPNAETDRPAPFGHIAFGRTGMADEVVQTEVITALQTVTVPFKTATETPLGVGTPALLFHAVVGLGRYAQALQPCLGVVTQVLAHLIRLGDTYMQVHTGVEEHIQFSPEQLQQIADYNKQLQDLAKTLDEVKERAKGRIFDEDVNKNNLVAMGLDASVLTKSFDEILEIVDKK